VTTFSIDDFRLGLDTRKSNLSAEPGSLQIADNVLVTAGGEIVKRAAFVPIVNLPIGMTKGLHGSSSGGLGTEQITVFALGDPATPALLVSSLTSWVGTLPTYVNYLQPDDSLETLTDVIATAEYGPGKIFVVGFTSEAPATGAPRNWWLGNLTTDYYGVAPLVSGNKMYRAYGPDLYFSGVGDPSVVAYNDPETGQPNTVNPGAGFIDMSTLDSDAAYLIGMEAYYREVAIFSRRVCILFTLDPDLANNAFVQLLRIGAVSNGSILQFGTGDVLFLSDNGVRSLRALNASLAAGTSDVGSPIDKIIQAAIRANPFTSQYAEAIIEPITGRYWLAIGNVIYVLSYWPSAKINAWTTMTLPFNVDHMTTAGNFVFIRSGDVIYMYAGLDGETYDNSVAHVRTPFMAADTPTIYKSGEILLNALVSGTWSVQIGMETDNPSLYELAATITGDTYSMQKLPFAGNGTHISFDLQCSDAAPQIIGALHLAFSKTFEK
jgi:hypothetical protein